MLEIIQEQKELKSRKQHRCNYCLQPIEKGSIYLRSVLKYDNVYTWKAHVTCQGIAGKLRMFDEAEEGVTDEDFNETIRNEYQNIMAETQAELYESKEFKYPPFPEQLSFVINYHNNKTQ